MKMHGVYETNPIDKTTKDFTEQAVANGVVGWTDPKLKRIVRLRLLSDPGFPFWDVSYCVGELLDGTPIKVSLPFDQLPKRGMRRAIVEHAKRDKVYALRLGVFDAISTLV
jgi:hypothetical protein